MTPPKTEAAALAVKWADYFETAPDTHAAVAINVPSQRKEIVAALRAQASQPSDACREALLWAMDEIDVLSNKLCGFAYPQGMGPANRTTEQDNYVKAVMARREALAHPAVTRGEIGFMKAMDMVEAGFANWKGKEHNQKWWKRIDGTPIPNDLSVNIAEAIVRALSAPSSTAEKPVVSVKPMRLSDDRTDYFVSIKVGNREVTPHVFRDERFKAEYAVAHYKWLLLGEPKPNLMAYSENNWPGRSPETGEK